MAKRDPSVRAARFQTSGGKGVPVSGVQAESVQRSPAEFQTGIKEASGFVNNLIELNEESFVTGLQQDVKASFDPEVAAIRTAGFESRSGRNLSDIDDNVLNASLIQQLGVDDVNHPTLVEARRFFKKLGDAQTQKLPLVRHAKTLAQAELKKLVSQNPLFESEIRQAAIDALGFDPTGSDIKQAFDLLNRSEAAKTKSQTPFEKSRDNFLSTGRFNQEQAEDAAFEEIRLDQEDLRDTSDIRRGNAAGRTFLRLGNNATAKILSQAMLLTADFQKGDPKSEGEGRVLLQNLFDTEELRLLSSTRGADADSIDQMMNSFRKTRDDALTSWDDGSFTSVFNIDSNFMKSVATTNVSQIPGVLEGQALFKDKFTDVWLKLAASSGNENERRILLAMDPSVRGLGNLANLLPNVQKALNSVDKGIPPETPEERATQAFTIASIFSGTNTTDPELARIASNASSSFGLPETIKLMDAQAVKATAIKNPKFAKQIQNMYTVERTSALQQANIALIGLETFPRTEGSKVTLGVDPKGRIVIQGDVPKLRSNLEGFSPIFREMTRLQESVRRLNNISSITRTYSGQVLPLEPNISRNLVDEATVSVKTIEK